MTALSEHCEALLGKSCKNSADNVEANEYDGSGHPYHSKGELSFRISVSSSFICKYAFAATVLIEYGHAFI